jgi:hypothetical protein
MEDRRGANRVSMENPEGKRPLGRPMLIWEYNINMDLQDSGMRGQAINWSGSG